MVLTYLSISLSSISLAQSPAYSIQGQVKKVINSNSKSQFPLVGTLSSGDKIEISVFQAELIVSTIHLNLKKQIAKQYLDANSEVSIFEYDFDNDGVNEIIVEHNGKSDPLGFTRIVEVFKYSGGLSERVGFLISGQNECVIDKNTIHFPRVNSQGDIGSTYVFQKEAFYRLEYENPALAEKNYWNPKKQ